MSIAWCMYCIFLLRSCLLRHDFLALVTLWYADFSSIYGHGGSWVSGDMARQRTSALVTVCDTLIFWYLAFLLCVVRGNGVDRVLGRRVVCIPAT